jgi:hypothetical protein
MPDKPAQTPIQMAWIAFTTSVRSLLIPQLDDRPLDRYLEFRDTIIALVQNQKFLIELNRAWAKFSNTPEIHDALLMELKAFPLAVEVAQATERPAGESKGWLTKWLGRASTVTSSVKDLLPDLPWYAKSSITLFKELLDLFKAKE